MPTTLLTADTEDIQTATEEIILSGTPDLLTGNLQLSYKGTNTLFIRNLPVTWPKGPALNFPDSIGVNTALRSGREREVRLRAKMPAQTPPGTYECMAIIGGKRRKILCIVHPSQLLEVHPTNVFLEDALPGKVYHTSFRIINTGNVAVKIPGNMKHCVMLDNSYICKSLSLAMVRKGVQGFMSVLDGMVSTISSGMVKPVEIVATEAGERIPPGTTREVHIRFTLPKDLEPGCNYSGNLNIAGNLEISYSVNA